MAKLTAAERRQIQAEAAAAAKLTLTSEDAHNILVLLERVGTTGVQEATLLAIIGQKLTHLKGTFQGAPRGEDTAAAAE
jgi:hypothetical protein